MQNINLLNKLIAQENEVLSQDILSPVIHGSPIVVRISGVCLFLRVIPRGYHNWGIFKCNEDKKSVTLIGEPTNRQKRQFLELLPRVQLIICSHGDRGTVGSLLNSDSRFSFDAASVFFPENVSLFDTVQARYDGRGFVYERHINVYPKRVDELKKNYAEEVNPAKVNTYVALGKAYAYAYNELVHNRELTTEERVKNAITRAGGIYNGFTDRGDTLTVQFTIGGETFTPTINAKSLRLESAGICLSGGDRSFDLQSFVHIAREGLGRDSIVRGDYSNYRR